MDGDQSSLGGGGGGGGGNDAMTVNSSQDRNNNNPFRRMLSKFKVRGGGGGDNASVSSATTKKSIAGTTNRSQELQSAILSVEHSMEGGGSELQSQQHPNNNNNNGTQEREQLAHVSTPSTIKARGDGLEANDNLESAAAAAAASNGEDEKNDGGTSSKKKKSSKMRPGSSSWLTRTKTFQTFCKNAFEIVDFDDSGTVDEKELYTGLLLIHLKLGMYVGPAACRPIGRERCHKVFDHYDDDNNGYLTRKEFEGVMMVLFSNVISRVLIQWSLTICIVPMVAQEVLNLFYAAMAFVYHCLVNLDEYSSIANTIELAIERTGAWFWNQSPEWLIIVLGAIVDWWQAVPDSIWNAAPLAFISCILGVLVVPLVIFKVDDFFQYLAERADSDKSGFDDDDDDNEQQQETTSTKEKKDS